MLWSDRSFLLEQGNQSFLNQCGHLITSKGPCDSNLFEKIFWKKRYFFGEGRDHVRVETIGSVQHDDIDPLTCNPSRHIGRNFACPLSPKQDFSREIQST